MGEVFLGVSAANIEEVGEGGGDGLVRQGGDGKVGRLVGADMAKSSGRGTKRRRYDSGLGFLDEEEVDDVGT
jgi:hypothetical protein